MLSRPLLLLSCAAVLLTACDKGPDRAPKDAQAGASQTLTIKTDGEAPIPAPKASGGKLAVLPSDVPSAQPVAAPAPARAVQPRPVRQAVDDEPAPRPEPAPYRDAARGDRYDRWFDDPGFDGRDHRPPSVRDCRRAERRGDPLAGSPACRDMMATQEQDLIEDCIAADRAGDPFALSRQCRRAMRY